MFNDMYDTFDNVSFNYNFPFSFELRNKPYLEMIDKAYDSWNYSAVTDITFEIDDVDVETDYLKLTLYNYRYEEVLSVVSTDIDNNTVTFTLNSENSEILIPNIYLFSVELFDNDDNLKRVVINQSEDNFFYVRDELC